MRDMLIALAVLVPIILLFAGLARACSFSPTGPSIETERLPTVDAAAELSSAAKRLPFDVRVPALPAGWRANSASSQPAAGAPAVRVGWLTPQGRYLRVVQAAAAESELVVAELGTGAVASGPVEVAGRRWVSYGGGGEPAWVAEFAAEAGRSSVRVLITGSGAEDDFRAAAAAVGTAQIAPPG